MAHDDCYCDHCKSYYNLHDQADCDCPGAVAEVAKKREEALRGEADDRAVLEAYGFLLTPYSKDTPIWWVAGRLRQLIAEGRLK